MDTNNGSNLSNLQLAFIALLLVLAGEVLVSHVQQQGRLVSGSEVMELHMASQQQRSLRVRGTVVSGSEAMESRMVAEARKKGIHDLSSYEPAPYVSRGKLSEAMEVRMAEEAKKKTAENAVVSGSEAMDVRMAAGAKERGIELPPPPSMNKGAGETISGSEAMELRMFADAKKRGIDLNNDIAPVPKITTGGTEEVVTIAAQERRLRRVNARRQRRDTQKR